MEQNQQKQVTMDQFNVMLNKDLKSFANNLDTLFGIITTLSTENEKLKAEKTEAKPAKEPKPAK